MNTDVVILGMPSSGKTVLLSVLGRKYHRPVDDGTPLGFHMRPHGSSRKMVETNIGKLNDGGWPSSTNRSQKTDLLWEVRTGNRKIFDLTSMDISGETFAEAFGPGGSVSWQSNADPLLGTTNGTYTAAELRTAVWNAKCVCLFVNIAIDRNEEQRDNFGKAMIAMCDMLDQDEALCRKTIVVLTQSHTHAHEIERAGGASPYLGTLAAAHDLYVIVKEKNIPVLAVSAVNEEPGSGNQVPKNFQSDGLFGFLLTVSGMVAPQVLGPLKSYYLNFLNAKADYYKDPFRPICSRVKLARRYAATGQSFYDACLGYLADKDNFELESCQCGDPSVILNEYRTQTENEQESIRPAKEGWKSRLEYDEAWDRQLQFAAQQFLDDGTETSADTIINAVHQELGNVPDSVLFGFSDSDLKRHDESQSYEGWIDIGLKTTIDELKAERAQAAAERAQATIEKQNRRRVFWQKAMCTAAKVMGIAAGVGILLFAVNKVGHLILSSANSSLVKEADTLVAHGEYEQAAATVETLHDSDFFRVHARDLIADGTAQRLRFVASLSPTLKKLLQLHQDVRSEIGNAESRGLTITKGSANPLSKGAKLVKDVGPAEWPTLPSLDSIIADEINLPQLRSKACQLVQSFEVCLQEMKQFIADEEKDWNELKWHCDHNQLTLTEKRDYMKADPNLKNKVQLAAECDNTANLISEQVDRFVAKYSEVLPSDNKAQELKKQANDVIESLPYLVKIVAVNVSTSLKVDIEKNTWFGRGLPDMANDVDPLTDRRCIYMLVKTGELGKAYTIPVKVDGVKRKNGIEFNTYSLHHGLNIYEVQN